MCVCTWSQHIALLHLHYNIRFAPFFQYQTLKQVVTKTCKKYGVKNAYLFGSYAKQTATENSDVDVLTTESIKPRFFELIKDDRVLLYGA